MKKSGILLLVVGSLIGVGIILSFYGNFIIFEDLVRVDGEIEDGEVVTVNVHLDKTKTQSGVFAVQIIEYKGDKVTANILDPSNSVIESKEIREEAYEGYFEVINSGNYTLSIESVGEKVTVFGVIGPEPDEGKKFLTFVSLYILIIGLFGMAGVAAYLIISRRKSN